MKKLFCILGETSRGKDTFARILENDYGLRQVVSCTTRPMRSGEQEGREHYFISEEQFYDIIDFGTDEIVAYTQIGDYHYFATKDELMNSDIYIIDPIGLDSLKDYIKRNHLDISICAIYITSSYDVAKERAILRGDDLEVFEKRSEAERIMFEQFDCLEHYDYKYTNDSGLDDLKLFAKALFVACWRF